MGLLSEVARAAGWVFARPLRAVTKKKIEVTNDHGVELRAYTTLDEFKKWDLKGLLGAQPAWLETQSFYFRSGEMPDPPGRRESWSSWGFRHGGEDVHFSHVLLILQATADRTIVVKKPQVNVTRWSLNAGIVAGPEGVGGNGLLVRRFYVALDDVEPVARYIDNDNQEQSTATFTMSKGETVAIVAIAECLRDRVEWTLDMPMLVNNVEVTIPARGADGKPFVTVGADGLPARFWVSDERRWTDP